MASSWRCECGSSWGPHVNRCEDCRPGNVSTPTKTAEPEPTVAVLWEEWKVPGAAALGANTWRSIRAHRSIFGRTKVKLDDGTTWVLSDLPWSRVTARTAEIYRAVREQTRNRRKKADGTPDTIKPTTVNHELNTLQAMFNYFVRVRKTIPENPIAGWVRVDDAPYARQTYLTPQQVKDFIEAGCPTFQDICWTAYQCAGLRQSEARLLRKSEVDFTAKVINLPAKRNKNKRARVVPFASETEAILKRCCDLSRGVFVFVSPIDPQRAKPVPASTFQRWLTVARARSRIVGFDGEKICAHTLRHAAVTDMLTDKNDPTAVMAAAGMSPQTLQRYSKFAPQQQDRLREYMETKAQRQTPPEPEPRVSRLGARRTPPTRSGRAAR